MNSRHIWPILAALALALSAALAACDDAASKPAPAPATTAPADASPTRDSHQRPPPLRPDAQLPLRIISEPLLFLNPSTRTASTQPAAVSGDDAPAAVFSVAWSPDGALLVTGAMRYRSGDVRARRLARRIDLPANMVPELALSADGKLVAAWMDPNAAGASDGRVFELATGAVKASPVLPQCLWLPRGGSVIASRAPVAGGPDVTLWNVIADKPILTLKQPHVVPTSLTLSPDGKFLALATQELPEGSGQLGDLSRVYHTPGEQEAILIVATETGQVAHRMTSLGGGVERLAFSPDGRYLAGACQDCTIRVWELATWRELFSGTDASATHVVFSPDSTLVATQNRDRTATVFDLRTGQERFTFNDTQNTWVEHLAFSPDGALIAGNRGTKVGVWDTVSGKMLAELDAHTEDVQCLAFSPDGKRLVSGGADGLALVWDMTRIVPVR